MLCRVALYIKCIKKYTRHCEHIIKKNVINEFELILNVIQNLKQNIKKIKTCVPITIHD